MFSRSLPSTSSLPLITPPQFPLQNRANLQEMKAKQDKRRYNQTMQKPSYPVWRGQPSRKKRAPRAGKRVRDRPAHMLGVPQKPQSNKPNMYALGGDLAQCREWVFAPWQLPKSFTINLLNCTYLLIPLCVIWPSLEQTIPTWHLHLKYQQTHWLRGDIAETAQLLQCTANFLEKPFFLVTWLSNCVWMHYSHRSRWQMSCPRTTILNAMLSCPSF